MSRYSHRAQEARWACATVAIAVAFSCDPLAAQNTSIAGTVKTAAGQGIAGALVKVNDEKSGLGFMAVTQEQGRYSIPKVLPGRYSVMAFGADVQSPPSEPVEIGAGREAKLDLILNAPLLVSPREKPMSDADFAKLLPEASTPFIKDKFSPVCSECHSLERILTARKTPEKWRETMDRMQYKLLGYRAPLHYKYPIQGVEDERMWKYLSEHFGPDVPIKPPPAHPNRNLPGSLLKGASAKYMAMEFSLPPGSVPTDVAIDSKGMAWVTESTTGMLGKFDPNSFAYRRVQAPSPRNSQARVRSVAIDPLDRVWFADDSPTDTRLLRYEPKDGKFQSYALPNYRFPLPPDSWPRIGTLGFIDGNVWASGMSTDRILKVDGATGKVSHYPVPRGSVPLGLVADRDKKIWFAGQESNRIYRLDPDDLGGEGVITPYEAPTLRSDLRGLGIDANGNFWVAALNLGKLLKMDRTGKYTEYAPPTENSGPVAVAVDAKRNLVWFSEIYSDKIARFDPKTDAFVEFPHPSADAEVQRIAIDTINPNRIWWVSARTNKIGYIEVAE